MHQQSRSRGDRTARRRLAPAAFASLAAAALAATLAVAVASAHMRRHDRDHGVIPAAAGVVEATPSAGATSFTIELRDGSSDTIDVSGSTTYLERGAGTASLDDVQQGDLVAVFGTASGSTVTATEVVIAVPRSAGGQQPAAAGIVQGDPTGDTFTIKVRGGATDTVDVSDSTTYYERGKAGASLSDVTSGELVCVFGSISSGTITASSVVIHRDFHRGFALGGVVQATPGANASSFTIETRAGTTVTVDVTGDTRYFERGSGSVTLASVVGGDVVGVFGQLSSSDTITARAVVIASPPTTGGNYATAGTVQTSPSDGDFVIETCDRSQLTVDTTGATQFIVWGSTGASIDDVKPGEDVAVFGTLSGQTLTATQVVIGGDERAHPGYFSGARGRPGDADGNGRGRFGGRRHWWRHR
jgi:hypothetical protein